MSESFLYGATSKEEEITITMDIVDSYFKAALNALLANPYYFQSNTQQYLKAKGTDIESVAMSSAIRCYQVRLVTEKAVREGTIKLQPDNDKPILIHQ